MPELLTLLLIFMIIAAVLAIESEDLLSAVVSMGAVGFGLSVCFILLRAPEAALAQIVVEVVILIVLLRGIVSVQAKAGPEKPGRTGLYVGVVLVGLLLALSVDVAGEFPKLGEPSFARFPDSAGETYLKQGLALTGAANIVAAVLLDFRGLDSLGEVAVLFAALLGVMLLVRKNPRPEIKAAAASGPNGPPVEKGAATVAEGEPK
jgi:multisubunit Na+/H+ antiporter MnhB subunit